MTKMTSIALSDHFTSFIKDQVSSGRYGSTNDVVLAGLRLLEEHEIQVQTLQSKQRHVKSLPADEIFVSSQKRSILKD